MRGLFRSALALFTVGFAMTGCNRPGSGVSSQKPIDSPHQANFRVPGMT
jgi:hypothetical protein